MSRQVKVADSVTKLDSSHRGMVAVVGSHGGIYTGHCAAVCGVAAAVFNDAGIGKDQAGIAALDYLQALGIAAATAGHESCRIGDGEDTLRSGVLSQVNALAEQAGCRPGMAVSDCVPLLCAMPAAEARAPGTLSESRLELVPDARVPVVGIDSISLLRAEDAGAVVVAASHGGVQASTGGDSVTCEVLAAAFHDAGGGKEEAGFGRLPSLAARGIAAVTVSADSARIGDARSCYEDGVISRVNAPAAAAGAAVGMPLKQFVAALLRRDFQE